MIRAYRAEDCDALLDVWARASAVAHSFLSQEFLDQERRNIPEIYLPNAETWVWESEGKVVGFLALIGNEVGAIFVDPCLHRSGVGRSLIELARKLRGELEVEVFEKNQIGRSFYAKMGFGPASSRMHEPTGNRLLRLRLPAEYSATNSDCDSNKSGD